MKNKLSFTLVTSEFRGDHATDVRLTLTPKENESLDDFIQRIMFQPWKSAQSDVLEVRQLVEEPVR